jgi:CSLREA domain-containing protein
MNHPRTLLAVRVLLALCFASIALGLSLFFPAPPPAHAATVTVNSLFDTLGACAASGTGTCTLRDAITYANTHSGADIINITANGTIVLGGQLPQITTTITINGPGANLLTISGDDATQIVYINSPGILNLNDLTVAHGFGGTGGAIQNYNILRVSDSVFKNNRVSLGGGATAGAIYTSVGTTLSITNTSFYTNTADGSSADGGAIRNNSGFVTIKDSYFSGNTATSGAGAILNEGNMFITNTIFYSNSADFGGAIYASSGGAGARTTITGTTFLSNTSSSYGAGVYNGGYMTITNSALTGNTSDLYGGGLYQNGTLASIFNSTFYGNSAQYGGGIYKLGGTLAGSNSTFSNNHASSIGSGLGGGVYSAFGTSSFINSTFDHNSAAGGFGSGLGGGLYVNSGSVLLLASTVNNNSASGGLGNGTGGGIFISGTLSVINSTIANNSASAFLTTTASIGGAGIYNNTNAVTTTLYHTTIAGNVATFGAGAGISNTGAITLYNTIVANNTAASQSNCSGTIGDGGGNLQYNPNTGCASISSGDPKLATLGNYGGPTQTMALLPGSAAMDVPAADAGCVAISLDQRGWHRPYGPHCDIGAYELGALLYLPLIMK